MKLSKSKYCSGIQCLKILWLEKNKLNEKEEQSNDSILDNGKEVGELAKELLGEHINIYFDTNLNNMIKDTKNALKKEEVVITEASFVYDDNFCSVDILKKNKNEYEIYEVKSSTKINEIYLHDISYQYYVLKGLNLNVTKCFIVYINNKYIRKGNLNIGEFFNVEDVTNIVLSKQKEIPNNIKKMKQIGAQKSEPNIDIGNHCVKPYECPFFKYCTKKLPKQNVFNIRRMSNKEKFSLYAKGKYSYEDLLLEEIDWKFKEQIEFELKDKSDKIELPEIKKFLNALSYPLYFLDFETFQQPIPKYNDVSPYMQIPFQYSLHYIEKEGAFLKHKEFLAREDIDPRRSLAEQLVKDIPLNVCTIAYNMMFEKMVIKNLAKLFPDLSEHLMNIYDNMHDLMMPFKDRNYYSKNMLGSYSIKYVLPALFPNEESLNYHNLDMIHNGSEAMSSYASMSKLTQKEREKLRYNLLRYCELDTYAMVKIWEYLLKL